MNVSSVASRVTRIALAASFVVAVPSLFAQASPEELMANGVKAARLIPSATQLAIEAGKSVPLKVSALDSAGKPVNVLMFMSGPRSALTVTDSGTL